MITMFREGEVDSSVLDLLQAQQAKLRTAYLLQRKIDGTRADKALATKELGRAVKSAWEALSKQCASEVWTPVADALGRLERGMPTEADLKTIASWSEDMRRKFLRHDAAVAEKSSKLGAIKGRLDDLEIALRKIILDTGEAPQQAAPQMDLPGTAPSKPAAPSGWHSDQKTRRVVVDVFAEEVSTTRALAADESAAEDKRASLLAQAAADEALQAALRAMGIGDEPLASTEGDDEGDEDVEADNAIEATAEEVEPDPELEAAEKHEALQGAPKQAPKRTNGRGRGRKSG